MDLRRLRHFVMVADELHFGRAAVKLNMTQPPLSQSIQALEAELGVQLFARTKRTVALTPVGGQWLPHVRKVLAGAQELARIAERLSRGDIGQLRLAFVSTATASLLPPIISRLQDALPEVEITLREATSDVQVEALLDGDIDAGFLIMPHTAMPAQVRTLSLHREDLVAAVPEAWIVSKRIVPSDGMISFAQIGSEPLILFPRPSAPALHDLITGYFASHGSTPRLGQKAVQMQTIIGLVSAGIGMALVPASMQNVARRGVAYLPLAQNPPVMETGLAWRRDNTAPALLRLIELVTASATEVSP